MTSDIDSGFAEAYVWIWQQAHREFDDCLFDDLAAETAAEPSLNSR